MINLSPVFHNRMVLFETPRSRPMTASQLDHAAGHMNGAEAQCSLTAYVRAIASAPSGQQLDVLSMAAAAMAKPIQDGEIDIGDVVDRLQGACEIYGVVAVHGQDAVQRTLAEVSPSKGGSKKPNGKPPHGPEGPNVKTDQQTADNIEIARLAGLKRIDYDRERTEAAKRLGIRAPILDKLVEAERPKSNVPQGQGRALVIPDPALWPHAVDGAELLADISDLIRRHVVMSHAAADAVALWIIHTHAFDAAQIAPRLLIKSPEKRCGKTTALMVIQNLVYRPLPTSNITTSALFRTIEAVRPTLLIDEVDTFLSTNEELRGIINSGHFQATAHVTRTVGDDFEPRQFSTWAPMATSGIGKLPETIEDRGIAINLRRRRRDEHVQRLRFDRVDHLKEGASRAFRWAKDHRAAIANLDSEIPEALHDRAADNWRPLLAIADCAGGEWPARARKAALELSADSAADQDSTGTLLLADTRAAFEAKSGDRISGDDLTAYLVGLDDRPWSEFNRGKPLTKPTLARLLGKYKILSGTIRLSDGRTLKGYYRSSFDEAFACYLSPKNVTPSQAYSPNGCDTFQNVTGKEGVTLSKASQAYSPNGCDSVTLLKGENGDNVQ